MWKDLSNQWQTVFEEAWRAFGCGSTPVGAAIFDDKGKLILSDRNRSRETGTINREISHAEANAMRRLDTDHVDSGTSVLYTSMEPCPMCMGTILMGHIKTVHFAAFDGYCGMVHLTYQDPYYISKNVTCIHEGGDCELFQLTIQGYHELRYVEQGASVKVLNKFYETNNRAVENAKKLYAKKLLDDLSQNNATCREVFDMILDM